MEDILEGEKDTHTLYLLTLKNSKTIQNKKMTDFNASTARLLQAAAGNGEFDIALLDQVVAAAYNPMDPSRAAANQLKSSACLSFR